MEEELPRAFAGIDWALAKHDVCLMDDQGNVKKERQVQHTPVALDEFCTWLAARYSGAHDVAVAIEVPHGPVVETLLERGFRVYAVNPKQLDRFRDRFSPSGAKDDRLDARVLADSLRTDRRAFRRVVAADPRILELRAWSREHQQLKAEITAISNRIRQQLRRYYHQIEQLGDVTEPWILDLWDRANTPEKGTRLRRVTVAKILKDNRIRRVDASEVIGLLRGPSLVVADGTSGAAVARLNLMIPRLRLAQTQVKLSERRLKEILEEFHAADTHLGESEHHDVAILHSFPGLGIVTIAVLLAEAWQALSHRNYTILRSLAGQAPVTRRSGQRISVLRRQSCSDRLSNAMYHWSRVASQCDAHWKEKYVALRARGHSHGRALRTVGDRLLEALCAALRSRTLYEPAKRRQRRSLENAA